jgi:4'-phosphopantetheinyl transferase
MTERRRQKNVAKKIIGFTQKNVMAKLHNQESKIQNGVLYPVILPVPSAVKKFKPKDRVTFLSRHARWALEKSAEKSGIRLGDLVQDENGAPVPIDGVYWSISHKTQYVGGVVAPTAIGMDIEKIRNCSHALFLKTANEQEWSLAGAEKNSPITFFRFWTSKEAVVKACGTGIKDLMKCRINQIPDADHLEIRFEEKNWWIEHFLFDGHMASIVTNNFRIDWTIEK